MIDETQRPAVYVLITNWNGWADTIECLASVFHLEYPSFRVILCDNGSENGSMEYIKAWARGELDPWVDPGSPLRELSSPPVPRPIRYVEYDRCSAEAGGDPSDDDVKLILIQTGSNLGFAGGSNVGLRYALARGDFDYIWLLNNDAVVTTSSLEWMVERLEASSTGGLCGSLLKYYYEPDRVQSPGGAKYNPWLGTPSRIAPTSSASDTYDEGYVEGRLAYIVGASMLVSKEFLVTIGLMCEDYFLCFEELDWAVRSKGRFSLCFSPKSVVYHKDGRSIGTQEGRDTRSAKADYYNIGNRLVFTRKHYPWALPTVYLGIFATLLNRIRRRQWDRVRMVLELAVLGSRNLPPFPGSSLVPHQTGRHSGRSRILEVE